VPAQISVAERAVDWGYRARAPKSALLADVSRTSRNPKRQARITGALA